MTSLTTGSDHSPELQAFTAPELAQLLHADPSAPVQYPTLDQTKIIEAPLEPMLVIAGAGSGKTKTMADRVVWLVANGHVRPEQVLGVTFTRKASGELSTRIRQRLTALYNVLDAADGAHPAADRMDPSVSTYHSYSNGIVQDYGLRIGVERDAVMLGTAQAWQLASNVVEKYQGSSEHLSAATSTLVNAVLGMASECAEHLVTPADVRAGLEEQIAEVDSLSFVAGAKRPRTQAVDRLLDKLRTRVTVAHMADLYSAAKSGGRQLDFGDLVALAARIVSEVPEAVELEREKYKVVLLDEFQDTSFAQMVLFSKLFGDGRAVTAVGDPHQSIYGFRGASAGQLGTFRTRFPLSNDGEFSISPMSNLSVAWRNATSILAAANTVAAPLNLPAAWLRSLPRQEVPDLQPRPGAPVGEVYLGRFLSETPTASTGGKSGGRQPGGQNGWETGESAALAELVQRHRSRSFEKDALGRPLRPTVAVLCRGRRQFEPVRRELESRGIPVQIVGLGGLLRTPEIVELLAVLKVLGDPERSDAMFRLLAGARWRIGPADLMALGDWAKHLVRERSQRLGRRRTVSTADTPGATVVGAAAETAPQTGPTAPQTAVAGTAVLRPDASEAGSLVEAIDHLPPQEWISASGRALSLAARGRLTRLRDELRALRDSAGDDLGTLIGAIERSTLLDIEVAAKPGVGIHEARRNLDAFVDAADGFVASADRVDLPAFLAWLEAADTQEDGLPVTQLEASREAVQLLTVHAAKGLEWDVVLVPGLNEGSFPSGGDSRWSSGDTAIPWNLRGDAGELPQWDWQQPDQQGWLESEKLFTSDARMHAEREERRLAYVALTRAKHVLVCTSSVWGGGRTKPRPASRYLVDLLRLAEAGAPGFHLLGWVAEEDEGTSNPGNTAAERASWPLDPLRARRQRMDSAAAAVQKAADEQRTEPQAGPPGPVGRWGEEMRLALARHGRTDGDRTVELPSHISASLLVELSDDPSAVAARLRRPVPRRPGTAARRGTAFHAWIEEFYGSTGMLDLGEFPGAADSHLEEALDLGELIETFKGSEWARRVPAEIEVPVETRVGSLVVRGRIDAVFRDDDGAWDLIDWKTGAPPAAADLASRSVQLAAYRLAWSRLQGVPLEAVRAAFFYVSDGTLVRPHDLADSSGLEKIIRRATGRESVRRA